jgi:hypothetical protein
MIQVGKVDHARNDFLVQGRTVGHAKGVDNRPYHGHEGVQFDPKSFGVAGIFGVGVVFRAGIARLVP